MGSCQALRSVRRGPPERRPRLQTFQVRRQVRQARIEHAEQFRRLEREAEHDVGRRELVTEQILLPRQRVLRDLERGLGSCPRTFDDRRNGRRVLLVEDVPDDRRIR